MGKYIDVEPIIEWAKDPTANLPYGASGVDWEQKIFNAPTIDIVRCKECKFLEVCGKTCWCDQWEHYADEQDFCSHGERKSDE